MQEKDDGGSVRSVERALAVIELVDQHGELGLEEIHYLSGLPKATVSRLLHTLMEQGWFYRGMRDRRYRLSARRLGLESARHFQRHLVEVAAPFLEDLSERTGLVADLSYFDGSELHVMESAFPEILKKRYPANRLLSPLKSSLCHSAMGKACLTALSTTEVERLASYHQLDAHTLSGLHQEVHSSGFGERTEGSWEYNVRLPFLIRAIALPLMHQNKLIGSIALHWPQDFTSVQSASERHLVRLSETVGFLEKSLS